VQASEIAFNGVRNAQQELGNARVSMLSAQHDRVAAS
jgi:hypothetical protein